TAAGPAMGKHRHRTVPTTGAGLPVGHFALTNHRRLYVAFYRTQTESHARAGRRFARAIAQVQGSQAQSAGSAWRACCAAQEVRFRRPADRKAEAALQLWADRTP